MTYLRDLNASGCVSKIGTSSGYQTEELSEPDAQICAMKIMEKPGMQAHAKLHEPGYNNYARSSSFKKSR